MSEAVLDRFGQAYARHREAEGRGYSGEGLAALPYLKSGPLAHQWRVRARSFEALMRHVVRPQRRRLGRSLDVLDLGAGNGWLSYRLAQEGDSTIALDVRTDCVDGLGVATSLASASRGKMRCVAASFQATRLADASVDIALFNASLHYATDLELAVAEAARVTRGGGMIVILDTPFYRQHSDGAAMVAEKRAGAEQVFGEAAEVLLAPNFVEFLTPRSLAEASRGAGLEWRRRRVVYPLWYELRPLRAWLAGRRRPSRFDLWLADRP